MGRRSNYNAKLSMTFIDDKGETLTISRNFNSITKNRAQDIFYVYKSYISNTCDSGKVDSLISALGSIISKMVKQEVLGKISEMQVDSLNINIKRNGTNDENAGIYIKCNTDIESSSIRCESIKVFNTIKNFNGIKYDILNKRPDLFFKAPEENNTYFYKTINNKYILPLSSLNENVILALVKGSDRNDFRVIKISKELLDHCIKVKFDNNKNRAFNVLEAYNNPNEGYNSYFKFYIQYKTHSKYRKVYINDEFIDSYDNKRYKVTGFSINPTNLNMTINYKALEYNEYGSITSYSISVKQFLNYKNYIYDNDRFESVGSRFNLPSDKIEVMMNPDLIECLKSTENYEGDLETYIKLCDELNIIIDNILNGIPLISRMNYKLIRL